MSTSYAVPVETHPQAGTRLLTPSPSVGHIIRQRWILRLLWTLAVGICSLLCARLDPTSLPFVSPLVVTTALGYSALYLFTILCVGVLTHAVIEKFQDISSSTLGFFVAVFALLLTAGSAVAYLDGIIVAAVSLALFCVPKTMVFSRARTTYTGFIGGLVLAGGVFAWFPVILLGIMLALGGAFLARRTQRTHTGIFWSTFLVMVFPASVTALSSAYLQWYATNELDISFSLFSLLI